MPSITIKRAAKVRAATYHRQPIVARVDLGYASGDYAHPTLTLGVMSDSFDIVRFDQLAVVTFQQHRLDSPGTYRSSEPPPRGLLARRGWSRAYGAAISGNCEHPSQRRALRRMLDLLDKVTEIQSERYHAQSPGQRACAPRRAAALSCDLLATVVALRFAGVEIKVWRPEPERRPAGGYGSLAVAS